MKEEKLGGKKHGTVLVISIGKPGDKDPTHVADLDEKKKSATLEEILQEAASMRGAGDKEGAHRFGDVASAMERGPGFRESLINRLGMQAANVFPGMENKDMAETLFEEGKQSPDYIDARQNPIEFAESVGGPENRVAFMQAMSEMARGKERSEGMDDEAKRMLGQLVQDDPTKYFTDKRFMTSDIEDDDDYTVGKAKNILITAGLSKALSTQFARWCERDMMRKY